MITEAAVYEQLDLRSTSPLTDEDLAVIADVDRALADGLKLKQWWEQKDASNSYAEQFVLARTFNKPDRALGFFDTAPLGEKSLQVMGVVQEMLFDQPKQAASEKVRDELREFILHYFMRVSDFRRPAAYIATGQQTKSNVDRFFQPFSFCPEETDPRMGFGYSQLYYKLRGSGLIGKFPKYGEFAVVDLREIGEKYEWIVVKNRIFNFNLSFQPFGSESFALVFPLQEETYLALSQDFIVNEDNPTPDLLGQYGLGYALLKPAPLKTIFAYGPGYFSAGFQLINFDIHKNGQSHVRMAFVSNRPEKVLNLDIDPVDWSFRFADLMSLGMASRLFQPVKGVLKRFSPRITNFDPVSNYISLANTFSGGMAAEQLCISLETLEKNPMLLTHFMEHYQLIVGALMTWRQHQDWQVGSNLPANIVRGRS